VCTKIRGIYSKHVAFILLEKWYLKNHSISVSTNPGHLLSTVPVEEAEERKVPLLWKWWYHVSERWTNHLKPWSEVLEHNLFFRVYPLVNVYVTMENQKPFYSWVNPLFRLGHFLCRNLWIRADRLRELWDHPKLGNLNIPNRRTPLLCHVDCHWLIWFLMVFTNQSSDAHVFSSLPGWMVKWSMFSPAVLLFESSTIRQNLRLPASTSTPIGPMGHWW